MRAMRGHGTHAHPDAGVRAACLRALIQGPGESESDLTLELAGAQWVTDDLFAEVRGCRLQMAELAKMISAFLRSISR